MEEKYIKNEIKFNNNIHIFKELYNISKATVKIKIKIGGEWGFGSGFFCRLERNNKKFYSIITNEHVVGANLVKNKEEIIILYDNEKKKLNLKLDKSDRCIFCLKELYGIDATIIEILEKDGIDNTYFLLPDDSDNENYDSYIFSEIQIPQFPGGEELSLSNGTIIDFNSENVSMFFHDADTEDGSSGSPIILKGTEKVIGIHKGTYNRNNFISNIGIFIRKIIDVVKNFKRNGEGKEYYKNGKIKYEGNFLNDLYDDDNGKYYYENGDVYIGQFKNGEKYGEGLTYNKEGELINVDEYKKDKLINDYNKKKFMSNNQSNNINSNNNIIHNDQFKYNSDYNQNLDKNPSNNKIKNDNNSNFTNKDFKVQLYNILHPFGNFFGVVCRRCGHKTEKHQPNGYGRWKCSECPENDSICEIID